jgi:hypothetical protein
MVNEMWGKYYYFFYKKEFNNLIEITQLPLLVPRFPLHEGDKRDLVFITDN